MKMKLCSCMAHDLFQNCCEPNKDYLDKDYLDNLDIRKLIFRVIYTCFYMIRTYFMTTKNPATT